MRKIQDRSHPIAEGHRLDRAIKLARTIKEQHGPISQWTIEKLEEQSAEWWAATSKEAGLKSAAGPATIKSCIGILATEVPAEKTEDPFDFGPGYARDVERDKKAMETVQRVQEQTR